MTADRGGGSLQCSVKCGCTKWVACVNFTTTRTSVGGLGGRAVGSRHDAQLLAVLDPLRRARAVQLQIDIHDAHPRRPVVKQDRVRPRAVEPAADDMVLKYSLFGAGMRSRVERCTVPE